MQERHINREFYFEEQARTARKYYIPYICKHIEFSSNSVLEVGCGEGGNLLPFAEMGYDVYGVDMSEYRIEQARLFFEKREQKGSFITANIFQLKGFCHKFFIIIVHDVIEHIDNKKQFLSDLCKFLTPNGIIFIAFPAWQMPFGGHQQIAEGKIISHLPFIHLLPTLVYRFILNVSGEREDTIKELLNIKMTKCSIEQFISIVRQINYKIINQQYYLINPHYETKFGLTPRKLNTLIAHIPYLRNFVSTSCFYILKM
ncbi:MAG: methyltransferase domain-containing protein [Muribaculaceae bacterium]